MKARSIFVSEYVWFIEEAKINNNPKPENSNTSKVYGGHQNQFMQRFLSGCLLEGIEHNGTWKGTPE